GGRIVGAWRSAHRFPRLLPVSVAAHRGAGTPASQRRGFSTPLGQDAVGAARLAALRVWLGSPDLLGLDFRVSAAPAPCLLWPAPRPPPSEPSSRPRGRSSAALRAPTPDAAIPLWIVP